MANLLTLPPEVLGVISSNFCTCQTCNTAGETRAYQQTRRTLYALSATCRALQTLIQPLLYHRVYPFYGQIEFARTLVENTGLAASVRELYYPFGAYEDRQQRPLYGSLNKHAYNISGLDDDLISKLFNRLMSEQPGGLYDSEDQETRRAPSQEPPGLNELAHGLTILENSLLISILKMLPNLHVLYLWYEPEELTKAPQVLIPNLLPKLRQFGIVGQDAIWGGTPTMGTTLTAATPSLQSLHCVFVDNLIVSAHDSLLELVLTDCFLPQYEHFELISSGFPNLRKLTYSERHLAWACNRELTLRGICEALEPMGDRLQEFNVRLLGLEERQAHRLGAEQTESPHDSYSKGLSQMTGLIRLRLDKTSITDLGGGNWDTGTPDTSKIFPRNLQHLELSCADMPVWTSTWLVRWAPSCREQCPNLGRVTLHRLHQQHGYFQQPHDAELATLLQSAGVACTTVHDDDQDEKL